MSYAYFQGQEAQALAYYQKLLELERDLKARDSLAELVAKLKKIVEETQTNRPPSGEINENVVAA